LLSQDVRLVLGSRARGARIADIIDEGGFTHFRRAAETPFNLVLEARPWQQRFGPWVIRAG
jgi:hypothetical protein